MKKKPNDKTAVPPIAITAPQAPMPHPLELNKNELRWMDFLRGPIGGWFAFDQHGNPPKGVLVQAVLLEKPRDGQGKRKYFTCAAKRYDDVNWTVAASFPSTPSTFDLVFWRPLSELSHEALAILER